MGIRTKTLLIISLVFVLLTASLYAATQFLTIRSFQSLENKRAEEDTCRVKSALSNEIENLARMLSDWSSWDDTYNFIETRDPRFIEANLKRETLEDLKISMLLFYGPDGNLVHGRAHAADVNRLVQPSRDILSVLAAHGLTAPGNQGWHKSGIIMAAQGPMMVTARPILTTEKKGPARGAMIMGKWLDSTETARLSAITRHPIVLWRLGSKHPSKELPGILSALKNGRGVVLKIRDSNTIEGYSLIKDISGKPALVMKVPMRRDIYDKGISGTRYFYIFFLASGLISAALLILMLQKLVLSPLMLISNQISGIGKGGSLSARLSVPGKDELSKLARNVNAMLDQLEAAQIEIGRQETLQKSEEQYRALVEHSPSAVFIVKDGAILFANKAATELLGASFPEEIVGVSFTSFLRSDFREEFSGLLSLILEGHDLPRTVCSFLRIDSRAIHVEIAGSSFIYQDVKVIQIVAHDISRRMETEAKLKFMAYHDPLTEMPNRALFNSILDNAIMNAEGTDKKIAVMLLDLDRFKEINDTMGHKFGDEMLISVADRLNDVAGDEAVIARYSGDEFLFMFENLRSPREAEAEAVSLISAIAKPFVKHGHRYFITASIGISIFPNDGYSVESLIMNADIAMYRAKARGSGHFIFFSEEIRASVLEKRTLEAELRKALEMGDGLSLHYQPLIDIEHGGIMGVEALARWEHRSLGKIPPRKFIPVAEETGLIIPLGEWALQTACTDCVAWRNNGVADIRVAVNLSPRQFQHENLHRIVSEALSHTGLPPDRLELEITESAAMLNIENAVKTLQRINALGVCFSIDDFGTGYSSLSYLRQFPISSLKIDASFVRNIFAGPDTAAIIKAIIAMSHSMNMKVTAEAVETVEQLNFLRGHGCDTAQGFLLHKPMPATEFELLMLSSNGNLPSTRIRH